MLTQETIAMLNAQVVKEMEASNLYLSLSSWCYENSFDGAGKFLYEQSVEEADHARKLVRYLNETDSKVTLSSVGAPKCDFTSLLEVFEEAYENEKRVTGLINNLVDHALNCKDYSTFNFLQWYVSEQHQEEAVFRDIVDKIRMLSSNDYGLYMADQYIKTLER